ncbi:MAG: YqaJ viral recombinase family protein [Clostridiales bacterium]|nr:YqaJ viral recombinase family protein [Clostridiales bacterium]
MKKLISTVNMPREEWLKYRKQGIGGSDAGAICGLNPYSTAMSVYADKTSPEISDEDNEAMRQGRDLEDYVASRFMEATGLKVRRSRAIYQNEEIPFMIADVDRLIIGQNLGLECKTASPYNSDKWKDDQVPAHYIIQCLHYMAVTGAAAWYLAVVILGREFKYVRIDRDEAAIQNLITIEDDFWNHHVIPRVMPDPDGSKVCDEVISRYYPEAKKGTAIPLIGFDEKLMRRQEIEALIKKLEAESSQIDQEIKLYMQDAETALSDRFKVTWTSVVSSRLDSKKIKAEQPEVYQQFLSINRSRRFRVDAA